jgi:lambda repressor-like predicted transcriptional regulator
MGTAQQIENAPAKRRGRPPSNSVNWIPALKAQLDARQKTLYSISQKTGIGYSTLHDVFTGKSEPSLRLSVIIASELGWTVDWFSQKVFSQSPLELISVDRDNSPHAKTQLTEMFVSKSAA